MFYLFNWIVLMEIKVRGEMSIPEFKQALFEKISEAEEMGVRYTRGATLFINPTNGFGDDVKPHKHGRTVDKLYSSGPYRSAADKSYAFLPWI